MEIASSTLTPSFHNLPQLQHRGNLIHTLPFSTKIKGEGGRPIVPKHASLLLSVTAASTLNKGPVTTDSYHKMLEELESNASVRSESYDKKLERLESDVPLRTDPYHKTLEELENVDEDKMLKVCNKLIEVFLVDKPTPKDWRRLLTFSREWDNIRPHFYKRCQERADELEEKNPDMKHQLLRLARKLKEVDDDVQRHNELLNMIRGVPSEISDIVARRRKDFTTEFFLHIYTVSESYYDNLPEQKAVAILGSTCLAAVEAYDAASGSNEALVTAEMKFQDIITSPTLDVACRKIDNLANKNELDPALVLMISKAWAAAKDSNLVKDEAKDMMYHLYKNAVGSLQRLMPKEIRIIKYLLMIEDPHHLLSSINDAFTPGNEIEGKDVDYLYTTPEKLHMWIKTVLDAYHFSTLSTEDSLMKDVKDLMNPRVIVKLKELNKIVEKHFM